MNNKSTFIILLLLPFISFGQWTQIGNDIDGEAAGDESGYKISVSSDGNIVAIGARFNDGNGENSGHVRVYENLGGTWTQIGQDLDGGMPGSVMGNTALELSSDGAILAVGDPGFGNNGQVRVYKNINNVWTQIGTDIDGASDDGRFGSSVSISSDGSILAVGAPSTNILTGVVKVYENINNVWTQIGQNIDAEAVEDSFGSSVKLSADGSILAAGAIYNDGNGSGSGHVRVFENVGGTWTQIGQDIDGENAGDNIGGPLSLSMSADGSIVSIGAAFNSENGTNSGHVRVFENIGGTWTQLGQDIDGENAGDFCGLNSLSADGDILATGSILNDTNGNNRGYARIYENVNGVWTQIDQTILGEAPGDLFGYVSISRDGTTVAIGAPYNDGNGGSSGHVRVYRNATLSIEDNIFSEDIMIYPNPTFDVSSILLEKTYHNIDLTVYNSLGKIVSQKNYKNQKKLTINTQEYAAGIYTIKIIFGDKFTNLRLIKR